MIRSIFLLVFLVGCAGSRPISSPVTPALPPVLDSEIGGPCPDPLKDLPDEIDARELTKYLGPVIAAAADCRAKHSAAVDVNRQLRNAYGGQ